MVSWKPQQKPNCQWICITYADKFDSNIARHSFLRPHALTHTLHQTIPIQNLSNLSHVSTERKSFEMFEPYKCIGLVENPITVQSRSPWDVKTVSPFVSQLMKLTSVASKNQCYTADRAFSTSHWFNVVHTNNIQNYYLDIRIPGDREVSTETVSQWVELFSSISFRGIIDLIVIKANKHFTV